MGWNFETFKLLVKYTARFEKNLRSNKVEKVNLIKIYTSLIKYQQDWDVRHNLEEYLDIPTECEEGFRRKYKLKPIFRRFDEILGDFSLFKTI